MKTQHTPGEWITKEGQIYSESDGKTIAIICYYDETSKKDQANSKLIAAAPALLNALGEAKTIIYNLSNGLEKREAVILQAILDRAIIEATDI